MNCRGPGFLAVVWFGSSSAPFPLLPRFSKLSLFLSLSVSRRPISLTIHESVGGRGWARSQIIRLRESPSGLVQIKYTMTDGVDRSLELISPLLKHPVRYSLPSRVSFETSFDSKQPKLEPKLVSALSETKRLFWLFRFNTETDSFDVSIEPKQTEDQPKQFDREHILLTFYQIFNLAFGKNILRNIRSFSSLIKSPMQLIRKKALSPYSVIYKKHSTLVTTLFS
jgi:hypothetical protein